jgi:glycosyltransferase involved in cell wall biosynthesis
MSADETVNVAMKYPCTFLQREDSGPAQAINRGLDMATGDIVCWLNADDAFASRTVLERVVRVFSELPEIDMITGNGYYIDERGRYLNPIVNLRPDRFRLKWIRRHDFILQPATFWRRNRFRLDESQKYCFDWKLWIDCFEAGLNILYVPECFALYRIQPASLTYQNTASRMGEIYRVVKENKNAGAQIAWCWTQWKTYQLSELLRLPRLKRLAVMADRVLGVLHLGA